MSAMDNWKKTSGAAFLICALGLGPALAEEEIKTRSFDLPDFDEIDISAGVQLLAEVGAEQSVIVETKFGDFSDFDIRVRNGELIATREDSPLRWRKNRSDYKVIVSVRDLRSIEASSGAWGEISKIDAGEFSVDLSSGARLELTGDCGMCAVELSSGAQMDAKELSCGEAEVEISSGGHGILSVRDSVDADASSGGRLKITGEPHDVRVEKSSGGSVKIVK